jgi:hypothetical protein
MPENAPGYHLTSIPRGTYGEISKVLEEVMELEDAENQGNQVMILLELSDIIGAIRGYLNKNYPNLSLTDLIVMADATQRAFVTGERK